MSSLLKSSLSRKGSAKGKDALQRVKLGTVESSKDSTANLKVPSHASRTHDSPVASDDDVRQERTIVTSSSTSSQHLSSDSNVYLNDGTKEFRQNMNADVETIFDELRDNLVTMEFRTKASSIQALEKDNLAFFEKQDSSSIKKLQTRQERELERVKQAFVLVITARDARKRDLIQQFNLNTSAENHDITIQELDASQAVGLEIKEMIDDYRAAFETLQYQYDSQHTKIRKQLSAVQERRLQDKKTLIELETTNLTEELRMSRMKKFQFQINHQKMIDKKVSEHFRSAQMLENRQTKELFELELKFCETLHFMKVQNSQKIAEMSKKQRLEVQEIERNIRELDFDFETNTILLQHQEEVQNLKMRHRAELKIMRDKQLQRQNERKTKWAGKQQKLKSAMQQNEKEMSSVDVDPPESLGICELSFALSDISSFEENLVPSSIDSLAPLSGGKGKVEANEHYVLQDPQRLQDQVKRKKEDLITLIQAQKKKIAAYKKKLGDEYAKAEAEAKEALKSLTAEHLENIRDLENHQIQELKQLKITQEKEALMEEHIMNSEHNMMLERKRLNSMFQTVVDGIIIIDTVGVILRFNSSAERMFGYYAGEVLGKNIKVLQTEEISSQHDMFLRRYLETGVKRVIGSGRATVARKKDGTVFPVHLSLSEVKSEGVHIFTGVVRDLTEEVKAQESAKKEREEKKIELEQLIKQLAIERGRSSDLINSMLPPAISARMLKEENVTPESFSEATVLFTEISGYPELATQYSALDIVDLLNELYCVFDEVVLGYAVYKVETIGDSYVCVSGVPNYHKDHCAEISKLALHFRKAISFVRMKNHPEIELKLKVGIHSGPLVAGIVGLRSPRYCLFGDTVNTASRMKSTSDPMQIQVSAASHKLLTSQENSPYRLKCRGEVEVKGKGTMLTYYLDSIDGFECDMSSFQQMNILNKQISAKPVDSTMTTPVTPTPTERELRPQRLSIA